MTRDLTPEHTKRGSIDHATVGEIHPDINAAYDYVDSVAHTADVTTPSMWYGWALREAFLAGISFGRSAKKMAANKGK